MPKQTKRGGAPGDGAMVQNQRKTRRQQSALAEAAMEQVLNNYARPAVKQVKAKNKEMERIVEHDWWKANAASKEFHDKMEANRLAVTGSTDYKTDAAAQADKAWMDSDEGLDIRQRQRTLQKEFKDADIYTRQRAAPALKEAQDEAKMLAMTYRGLQQTTNTFSPQGFGVWSK